MRRQLGIGFPAAGEAQLFAVWELFVGEEGPALQEARAALDSGGKVAVCWPLGRGWYRMGFEVDPGESSQGRPEKSREVAMAGDASHEHLERSRLSSLVAERAPWFTAAVRDVAWSRTVRFERRLAESYGAGPVWLLGDAAHLAPPVAAQSMNLGLQEARALAVVLEAVLRKGERRSRLDEWAKARRAELEALLVETPKAGAGAPGFARKWAKVIADTLPVSGADRGLLLGQAGLLT